MLAKIRSGDVRLVRDLDNHREKMGRGSLFSERLCSHGLQSAPWDLRVLYNVFDYYARVYKPGASRCKVFPEIERGSRNQQTCEKKDQKKVYP